MTGKQFLKKTFAGVALATIGTGAGTYGMFVYGGQQEGTCLNDANKAFARGDNYDRSCQDRAVLEIVLAPAVGAAAGGVGLILGVTCVGRRKKDEDIAPPTTTERVLEKTFYGVAGLIAGSAIGLAAGWTAAWTAPQSAGSHHGEWSGLIDIMNKTAIGTLAGPVLGVGLGVGLSGRKKTPAPERT